MFGIDHLKIIYTALEEAAQKDARWLEQHYHEAKDYVKEAIASMEQDAKDVEAKAKADAEALAQKVKEEAAAAEAKAKAVASEEAAKLSAVVAEKAFNIGDAVELNSGGPAMTVMSFPTAFTVECNWLDSQGTPQSHVFDIRTLKKYVAPAVV